MTGGPQDVGGELAYQSRQAAVVGEVRRTPEATIRQYREHVHWRIFHREYFFYAIQQAAPRRICNIGCGAGETSTELAAIGYEVVSYDLSPEFIAMARKRAELDGVADRARFEVADVLTIETVAEPFDLVLIEAALHHMDLDRALAAVDRLLKPGGVVVIQEPIAFSPWLQRLRDRTPVSKDISPNERQLNQADIAAIEARFKLVDKRFFHLFSRLLRLPGEESWLGRHLATPLRWMDHLVMSCLPFMRTFAGVIVVVCRKPQMNL